MKTLLDTVSAPVDYLELLGERKMQLINSVIDLARVDEDFRRVLQDRLAYIGIGQRGGKAPAGRDEYIKRHQELGFPPKELVDLLGLHYGLSERQAKRLLSPAKTQKKIKGKST